MWHMPGISAYREVEAGWSEIQGNTQQQRIGGQPRIHEMFTQK